MILSQKTKKRLLASLLVLICLGILLGATVLGINAYVVQSQKGQILSEDDAGKLENIDCILVLGCGVKDNGEPSDMLADRLTQGVALYDLGASPKLLMSGDHHRHGYNEVQVMKNFAINAGIDSADIFMDHAGLSTYDSLWRAKEIFGADKILIVTQEYHLYRALHIAKQLGMEAYGVASDYRSYRGQFVRDVREILARNKDFVLALFCPEASIGGEKISLAGSGDVTND